MKKFPKIQESSFFGDRRDYFFFFLAQVLARMTTMMQRMKTRAEKENVSAVVSFP